MGISIGGPINGGGYFNPFTPQQHVAQVRAYNQQQRAQQAPKPQTAPGGIMPSRPGQPLTRAPGALPNNRQFQGTRTPPPAQVPPPQPVVQQPPGWFDPVRMYGLDPVDRPVGGGGQLDPGQLIARAYPSWGPDGPFGPGGRASPPTGVETGYAGQSPIQLGPQANPLFTYDQSMNQTMGGQNNNVILGGPPQLTLPGQSQPATSKYQSTLNPGQSAAPTIAGAPAPGTSDSSPSQLYNNYAGALFGKGGGTAPVGDYHQVGDTTAQTNQMQSMPVDQGYLPASQAQTQNQIYPQPYNTSPFNTLATPSAMPQSRMI